MKTIDCQSSPEQTWSVVNAITSLPKSRRYESDLRIEDRTPTLVPVRLNYFDGNHEVVAHDVPALTRDISAGGIGLLSHTQPASGIVEIVFDDLAGNSTTESVFLELTYCRNEGVYHLFGGGFRVDWSESGAQFS